MMLVVFVQEGELSKTGSFADDGEILDGIMSRSRGEVRHVCSPKVMSSTPILSQELTGLPSPMLPDKVYSARISQLRGNQSHHQGVGRGPFSPGEARPSNLRKSG